MRRQAFLAVAAALLGAALYLNSLPNEFVLDDRLVIERNEQVRSLGNFAEIFTTPYHYGYKHGNTGLYRPLTIYTFALDHAIGGLHPVGYHVVNVLLHAAVAGLVVLLGLALGLEGIAALAGGLLFAAHPVHTEAVANLAGRAELLAAAFFLLAMLGYVEARRRGTAGVRVLAVAAGCFLLGLLSKENAITFPLVAAAWELAVPRAAGGAGPERKWKGAASALAALLVPVAVYLVLRRVALGASIAAAAGVDFIDNPLIRSGLLARWATALAVFARYVLLLFVPWKLSPDYSYAQIVPVTAVSDPWLLAGLLMAAAILWLLLAQGRRHPHARFLGLFSLLTFSIVSNAPLVIGTIMAERLLYLPSVGFCLLIGCLFAHLRGRWSARAGFTLAVVVLGALSARTIARNLDWRSGSTLYPKAVLTSPRSVKVLNNMGAELLRRGQAAEAQRILLEARAIAPDWARARINLAQAYLSGGDARRAEQEAREAVRLLPADAMAWLKLAEVLEGVGKLDEEVQVLRKVLELEPGDWEARLRLGIVSTDRGDSETAERELSAAVREQPRSVKARTALGLLSMTVGKLDRAVEELGQAVELEPGSEQARNNLGNALREAGRLEESARCLEDALALNERFAPTHYNLGLTLEKAGRMDEARRRYLRALEIEPLHEGSLRSMSRLALRAGDPEGAIRYLDRILEKDERSEEGHAMRARLHLFLNRLDEAERDYRRVLELNPNSAAAHDKLGEIYMLRGDRKAARREWEEALRLAPGSKEVEENLRRLD